MAGAGTTRVRLDEQRQRKVYETSARLLTDSDLAHTSRSRRGDYVLGRTVVTYLYARRAEGL